jgi:capsular exopolysaccharide synthesis family protein
MDRTENATIQAAGKPFGAAALRPVSLRRKSGSPLLPFDGGNWRASEQYRIIRTKLVQHPRQPRMLVVSSAGPGDGKTVSAINVAGALALRNATVLLVDADFRRGSLAKSLGIPKTQGLIDFLDGSRGLDDVILRIEPFGNFFLLPAGDDQGNATELLDSPRWSAACAGFRKQFDFVVLDAPPIGLVADYDLIQAACDGVLFIVRPSHTNRSLCWKALRSIPEEKLIGVVVNCADESFVGKTSGYYHYYYYHSAGSERH